MVCGLPHPFTEEDREADYGYDISILQSEFAYTQVFDRPLSGPLFFEQVLRENLDLGRPKHIQLIFDRRVTKRTPGRFRTRVITDGVIPSLYVDYKSSKVRQYFKGGRALRTETTGATAYGVIRTQDDTVQDIITRVEILTVILTKAVGRDHSSSKLVRN